MDAPETPRRSWWRKKRWRIAAALWLSLPILFLLSAGPAWYSCCRWEVPPLEMYDAIYGVADPVLMPTPFYDPWVDYVGWWNWGLGGDEF